MCGCGVAVGQENRKPATVSIVLDADGAIAYSFHFTNCNDNNPPSPNWPGSTLTIEQTCVPAGSTHVKYILDFSSATRLRIEGCSTVQPDPTPWQQICLQSVCTGGQYPSCELSICDLLRQSITDAFNSGTTISLGTIICNFPDDPDLCPQCAGGSGNSAGRSSGPGGHTFTSYLSPLGNGAGNNSQGSCGGPAYGNLSLIGWVIPGNYKS